MGADQQIFASQWTVRSGRTVPDPTDLQLGNDAVEFERATILYADLSGSTIMVDSNNWQFSAGIYKSYPMCSAKLVRRNGSVITSYDGDRIMGGFCG
jgi:class 3 adenylate cyclase